MKARWRSLYASVFVAMVVVLGATLAPGWAEAATKRLIFASAGFHESNRFWTIARPDHLQFEPFWETLLGMDPKTGDPIPGLATKWEHSPDFKDWTFHLRKGVQFHNGYGELTSADVVHAHSLLVRPDSTATLRPMWATMEEVKTPDKHTVTFRFKNPIMPPSMSSRASPGPLEHWQTPSVQLCRGSSWINSAGIPEFSCSTPEPSRSAMPCHGCTCRCRG